MNTVHYSLCRTHLLQMIPVCPDICIIVTAGDPVTSRSSPLSPIPHPIGDVGAGAKLRVKTVPAIVPDPAGRGAIVPDPGAGGRTLLCSALLAAAALSREID